MPIRFYCPFCDQLLSIASRKAGAAIECPRCTGGVGVPASREPAPNVEPAVPGTAILLGPHQVALLFVTLLVLLGLTFIAGLIFGAIG